MFGESGVPGAMPAGGSAWNRWPQQAQRPPRSSIRIVRPGIHRLRRPQRAARRPARRPRRCHMAALPVPSGPERHPPRPQCRDRRAHRPTAEIDLDGRRSRQGGNRARRARRRLPRHRAQACRLAGGKRPRRPRRLHAARAPPKAAAHVKPDRALRPAGTETAHGQGQGLPRRGLAPTARQRRPRRDRRKMGLRHEGLHQVGMPRMRDPLSTEFPDLRVQYP